MSALSLPERIERLPGVRPVRRLLVPWLHRELIDNANAVTRLVDWYAGGGLERPKPDIREHLRFFGDEPMLEPIVAAFEKMAPPARDFVLQSAVMIGTGWTTRGWTAGLPVGRSRVIVLSGASRDGDQIRRTVLHEAAHGWLEPLPTSCATAAGLMDLREFGEGEGWFASIERHITSREARANALARIWEDA